MNGGSWGVVAGLFLGLAIGLGDRLAHSTDLPVRGRASIAADGRHPAPGGPVTAEVAIIDFDYRPASVTIRAGEAVRWTHRDGTAAHNVFGDDGSFGSAIGNAGLVFVHTFATPGRYTYRCSIHPVMTGEILVD
ncbi:MAG: plastocyanin/azurin family copper-binding protein [Dehalococcoidia bacterium]